MSSIHAPFMAIFMADVVSFFKIFYQVSLTQLWKKVSMLILLSCMVLKKASPVVLATRSRLLYTTKNKTTQY
jgi:hypothetical protein